MELSEAELDARKAPWRAYLKEKGLKTTQQRETIVEVFLKTRGHVALEELLAKVRKDAPGVGLATVYRTVKLMEEAGIADSRHFNSGQTLYEVADGVHHDHLICQKCGFIVEFHNEEIEQIQKRPCQNAWFQSGRAPTRFVRFVR